MNRDIIILFLILVALAILVAVFLPTYLINTFNLRTQQPPNSTNALPFTIQSINNKTALWQPTSVYTINFSALLGTASYAGIYKNNLSTQLANLQMLNSSGVNIVRIDVNFDPWLSNNLTSINKTDTLVAKIRSNGQKFCIADAAAESYRNNLLTWSQFKTAWLNRVQTLASRYHPYCYIVVKEPGWYFGMQSDFWNARIYNATEWAVLAENLTNAVRSVSPNTLVGVAVPAGVYHSQINLDLQFLQKAVNIKNLTFIGFDAYGQRDLYDMMQFLNQTDTKGKGIWIAETWSATGVRAFNASRSQLDMLWIKMLYYFALKNHVQMISPFFTGIFSSYDRNVSLSFYVQNRTPVFYEYQKIISSNRAGQLPSS